MVFHSHTSLGIKESAQTPTKSLEHIHGFISCIVASTRILILGFTFGQEVEVAVGEQNAGKLGR